MLKCCCRNHVVPLKKYEKSYDEYYAFDYNKLGYGRIGHEDLLIVACRTKNYNLAIKRINELSASKTVLDEILDPILNPIGIAATFSRDIKMVELLIAHGFGMRNDVFITICKYSTLDIVMLVHDKFYSENNANNSRLRNKALYELILHNRQMDIFTYLLSQYIDVNDLDIVDYPLYVACNNHNYDVCKMLLKKGYSSNGGHLKKPLHGLFMKEMDRPKLIDEHYECRYPDFEYGVKYLNNYHSNCVDVCQSRKVVRFQNDNGRMKFPDYILELSKKEVQRNSIINILQLFKKNNANLNSINYRGDSIYMFIEVVHWQLFLDKKQKKRICSRCRMCKLPIMFNKIDCINCSNNDANISKMILSK